jgi:hypothetical protein
MPWAGRVNGVTFDAQLGMWMAFGSEEMWTSADGSAWGRYSFKGEELPGGCPDALPASMIAAARMGQQLWAFGAWNNGCDLLSLLMWTSSDGTTWETVPQGGHVGYFAHGIATNGSVLAVAETEYAEGRGDVLTSNAGRNWTSHVSGLPASMLDLYGGADGFVAVGYRLEPPLYAPSIWNSEDGSAWVDVSPESAKGRLSSVVRGADGAYLSSGVDLDGSIDVWRSEDGRTWERTKLPSPGLAAGGVWPQLRLVGNGNRLVLVANTVIGWWFWTSNDGRGWSDGQPMPGELANYFGPWVAISGDRVVAFPGESSPAGGGNYMMVGRIVPAD